MPKWVLFLIMINFKINFMQIKNYLKILVFIFTLGMTLSAWGDYTVPNQNVTTNQPETKVFIFNKINIVNWGQLRNYIDQKLRIEPGAYESYPENVSYRKYILDGGGEFGSILKIEREPMPKYISSNYYRNATNINAQNTTTTGTNPNRDNYTIFKINNLIDFAGFIITASDGTSVANPIQIKNGDNVIFPLDTQNTEKLTIYTSPQSFIKIDAKYSGKLDTDLFVTFVFVPSNDIKEGSFDFNETIGSLTVYRGFSIFSNNTAEIYTVKLNIKGNITVTLPSCQINNSSIDLGTVSANNITSGNVLEKSTNLQLVCPNNIRQVYARVYDINDLSNKDKNGKLSLKCTNGSEASGVKVQVKVNDLNTQLGEKSFILPINTKTGKAEPITSDKTLIDLGGFTNGQTTKNIKISGKYVQDGTQQITPGCANAKMGIIFNYQ